MTDGERATCGRVLSEHYADMVRRFATLDATGQRLTDEQAREAAALYEWRIAIELAAKRIGWAL